MKYFIVNKLAYFGESPTYCNKRWNIGDIWKFIGTAYELEKWTDQDNPDDDFFENIRTKEIINTALLTDYNVSDPDTFIFKNIEPPSIEEIIHFISYYKDKEENIHSRFWCPCSLGIPFYPDNTCQCGG